MKLTVAMATYDDFDGVFFTIQSLRFHHALPPETEFLILDNHAAGLHSAQLVKFARDVPGMRIVPVTDRVSSFVKYDAFDLAQGEIILGLDCHVLLKAGFIPELLDYFAARPDSRDLLTGPIIYNALTGTSVKMNPVWRGHDFGTWADDHPAMATGQPFEVPMMGMGCYAFRRANAPRVPHHFRGFGAEEWYLAERTRQNGGRVICHPSLVWHHRFEWPPHCFPVRLHDRVANYYRGWLELYGSLSDPRSVAMTAHWKSVLPPHEVDAVITRVTAELTPPPR